MTDQVKCIRTLDGWRGIAVLMVVADHFFQIPISQTGVNIFFVLSGFLITTLLTREQDRTGSINLKRFYVHRFFRLMPIAWAYLFAVAVLGLLRFKEAVACIFFYRHFVHFDPSFTVHFWTLSVEEDFYLLWPMVLLLSGPDGWIGAVGLWSGLTAFNLIGQTHGAPLLLGCLTAYLPSTGLIPQRLHRAMFAICLVALLVSLRTPWPYDAPVTVLALIAFAIWSTAQDVSKTATALLESKVLVAIGLASYTVYVWQGLAILRLHHQSNITARVIRVGVLAVVSFTTYVLIEQPGRSLRRLFETNATIDPIKTTKQRWKNQPRPLRDGAIRRKGLSSETHPVVRGTSQE